jgi:hemoglobin
LRQGYARLNKNRSRHGEPTLSPDLNVFERLGGAPVIDALVERFYAEMDARPEARGVRGMHGGNLEPVKFVLKRYLGEWLGGPPLYSHDRGHPRLRMRHIRFPIGEAERDAWLACMSAALAGTIADAELRSSIYRAMASLADHMRNRAPEAG